MENSIFGQYKNEKLKIRQKNTEENRKYEYISALIKCLRRGLEEKSMYFALKLNKIDANYLWRRLLIFASEDVSIANNQMAILINSLYNTVRVLGIGGGDSLECLTQAILALCRTEKTRLNDFVIMEMLGKMDNPEYHISVPDFAYDNHTWQGKSKGRGIDYFLDESSKENNVVELKPFVRVGSEEEKKIMEECKVGNKADAEVCRKIGRE